MYALHLAYVCKWLWHRVSSVRGCTRECVDRDVLRHRVPSGRAFIVRRTCALRRAFVEYVGCGTVCQACVVAPVRALRFAGFMRVSCVMHLVRMFVMAPCAERA